MPKVPTGHDWQAICNNYGALTTLRETTLEQLGIKDPKKFNSHKSKEMTAEVNAFRVLIREKVYLLHPEKERGVFSIEGSELSESASHFCKEAREKRGRYYDKFLECEPLRCCKRSTVPFNEPPICITSQEENEAKSLKSKTVNELKSLIASKLALTLSGRGY